MHNPFFTVITVTYNSSQFVREAIESVLSSTFTDFELIIGDDCSTDNTWEIINEYNDPRIVKYRNETNIREYPNRNKALNMAKGDWVIFIDGDDFIYQHGLEVIYRIFQNNKDFSIAVMCPEMNQFRYPIMLSPKEIYEIEFSEFSIINKALSHTVYNRSILVENPFRVDTIFYGLDTLNRLQILRNTNCLLINDNLTWWRLSESQASKKIKSSFVNELYMFSKILFSYKECPLSDFSKKDYLQNVKAKLVRQIFFQLIKLNFKSALKIKKVNEIKWLDFILIFYKLNKRNPLTSIVSNIHF